MDYPFNRSMSYSKRKQISSFSPNFIHSLDAAHMMLTCLKMSRNEVVNEQGRLVLDPLSFVAVHDSYWTHPCDIPRLNQHLRDAFVELHNNTLTSMLPAVPADSVLKCAYPGETEVSMDLNYVKNSTYFFQ